MAKTDVVVISDIHIGDNSDTCWYNNTLHEPYLEKILEYVKTNADDLAEFVILGDLFDFWTYSPEVTPPTTQDIITANPNIFGTGKALDNAVTAMEGRVSYVVGNHDITITQTDLDKIPLSGGYKITKQPDEYMPPNQNNLYTHGHLYTIFNAPPYPRQSPAITPSVPLGHFVTRLIAYYVKNVKHDKAWDMKGQGAPAGRQILQTAPFLPLLKFVKKVYAPGSTMDAATVKSFVDAWVKVTEFPTTDKFTMADGSTMSIDDVKTTYANLFTDWVAKHNAEYVRKSVYTDGEARSMSWFTQQAAMRTDRGLVITGHTHYPTNGVNALMGDVNCGFECFSKQEPTRYSFARIKSATYIPVPEILQVAKSVSGVYSIEKSVGIPKGEITFGPLATDYSVYLSIMNNTNLPMNYDSTASTTTHGKWVVPAATIPPISYSYFWLQDSTGLTGGDAKLVFKNGEGGIYTFKFDCPFNQVLYSNTATSTTTGATSPVVINAKIGDAATWSADGVIPPTGHPLCVSYFISDQGSDAMKPQNKSGIRV